MQQSTDRSVEYAIGIVIVMAINLIKITQIVCGCDTTITLWENNEGS